MLDFKIFVRNYKKETKSNKRWLQFGLPYLVLCFIFGFVAGCGMFKTYVLIFYTACVLLTFLGLWKGPVGPMFKKKYVSGFPTDKQKVRNQELAIAIAATVIVFYGLSFFFLKFNLPNLYDWMLKPSWSAWLKALF